MSGSRPTGALVSIHFLSLILLVPTLSFFVLDSLRYREFLAQENKIDLAVASFRSGTVLTCGPDGKLVVGRGTQSEFRFQVFRGTSARDRYEFRTWAFAAGCDSTKFPSSAVHLQIRLSQERQFLRLRPEVVLELDQPTDRSILKALDTALCERGIEYLTGIY
jgi:hypothetical protein